MKTRITRIAILFGALFFAWSPLSTAAMPNGVMVFEFGKGDIYDFSQFYDCETERIGGISLTLCLNVDMIPNGKGKHTGTASFEFSGVIDGTLVGPASGSVSGKTGGKGEARLKLATSGKLAIPGEGMKKTRINVNCSGKIGTSGSLGALCKVLVDIKGIGKAGAKARFNDQLNGTAWALTIDVSPTSEKKFTGTGSDTLGYLYKVAGKYSLGKDTSTVEVKGLKGTAAKGAFAELKGLKDTGEAKVKIKVQGYKGSDKVPAEEI